MAQNFRVNESRNTMWIGIALLTAAAVVILALSAQDFSGSGRSSGAEGSATTTGTQANTLGTDASEYLSIPQATSTGGTAAQLNPPFQSSVPWVPFSDAVAVPEAQVGAAEFMPHPPFEASTSASIPELATDPADWMPHPPYATSESNAGNNIPRTYVDRIVPDNTVVPGLGRAPSVEIPQGYEATRVAEQARLAELRGVSAAPTEQLSLADFRIAEAGSAAAQGETAATEARGGTYLDRIVPDDSLVPALRGTAASAQSQQLSLADFRIAEAGSAAAQGESAATEARGGTYLDRIVPDDSLVPVLGRAPVAEAEYSEMPWTTPDQTTPGSANRHGDRVRQTERAHQPQ